MITSQRKLACILAADAVGYSRLMADDEAATERTLTECRHVFTQHIGRHKAHVVDTAGDSVLAVFASPVEAVECAAEIQKELSRRNRQLADHRRMHFRVGLNLGDVITHEDGSVYGDGVNIAARLQAIAEPGGICVSGTVYDQIEGKLSFAFKFAGEQSVKNIAKPVRVYHAQLDLAENQKAQAARRGRKRAVALISWMVGAVALVAALAWGGYAWQRWTTPQIVNNRLAVLPFVSLSPDQADEYFADGITEELIARLSRVGGLEVIARTSVMSYKGTPKKIAEVGRELNVGTVLEGSVRKEGKKLRITAQLIRTDNETHLWAESYDQDMKDALAIQKSIAERVVVELATRLGTDKSVGQEPQEPQNSEAYNAYLKGRFHANKSTLEGIKQGVVHFEQAIRLDPSFALAYAGLAEAYAQLPIQDDAYAKEAWPKVQSAALRAIELDPSLAEAYAALGAVKTFYDYDWPGAEAEFRRALALNPNSSATHWWYASYHLWLRNFDEAIAEMRRAVELDPLSIAKNMDLGWAYQFPGRWDESLEQFKRTFEMDRSNVQVLSGLGWAYYGTKNYEEAEATFIKEIEAWGREPWAMLDLNYLYAVTGDPRGLALLEEMERAARSKPVAGWTRACFYFGFVTRDGRYGDEMYRWLDEAVEEHSFWLMHTSNQLWIPFHSDPRWAAFRKKLGLPP